MSYINLRPYQQEAIDSVKAKFASGINKQVLVLATGTGKTIIFSSLSSDFIKSTKKKVLVLAHREELLTQAKEKLLTINPKLKVAIEQGENYVYPKDCDVVVASVPTLGRLTSKRLAKFNPKDFCMVIVDEVHHVSHSSVTYINILRYFGLLKSEPQNDWNKTCLLLGVTATPSRTDNQGLDQIFDETAYVYDILKAIQESYLSRIRAYRVRTKTDISNIKKVAGDFNVGELAQAVNNQDRNGLVIDTYQKLVPNTQALCFAVDVAHTIELCDRFKKAGIKASYIVGTTNKDDRAKRLIDFRAGKIKVMINAMVLTEGYDNESIETVLMARPTQSGILFQQMVGRGTRLFKGKPHLTIIDFVDNTQKQNLQTTASLLGYKGALDFKGRDILEVKEEVDKLLDLAPSANLEKLDIDKIKYAIEEVDLMAGIRVPDELAPFTQYDWHRYGEDYYRINLGNNIYLSVNKNLTGQYILTEEKYDKVARTETSKLLGEAKDLESAIKGGDYYIDKKYPDIVILIKQNANWRKQSPSEPQVNYLRKLNVNNLVINQLTKGEAAQLITKILTLNRMNKLMKGGEK